MLVFEPGEEMSTTFFGLLKGFWWCSPPDHDTRRLNPLLSETLLKARI